MADGNIAAGSTDAVNGGQLSGVKSSLEQQITQVSNKAGDAVKNVVKYDVDTNGNRLNSVSLIGGDTNAAVVLKNVAAGTDDTDAVNVKQLKGVQSSLNQLGALAVQYDDSSKISITLGGAGGTRITNVQAGTLSATSTDAVNGSQLYATNQQVAKNTTDITNLQERDQHRERQGRPRAAAGSEWRDHGREGHRRHQRELLRHRRATAC